MKNTWMAAVLLVAQPTMAMNLLVPAYFYPSTPSFWDSLTASASNVAITAILNPNNGPGTALDPLYGAAVSGLQSAGGSVVGYVHTQYGARDINLVKADILAHVQLYGVNGIFLDEMSNVASALPYYLELYRHINALSAGYTVIGNPGTQTLEAYLGAADVLVTFENREAHYATYTPDAWTTGYAEQRFAHLVYDAPDAAAMQRVVHRAAGHQVGYLYVTSDRGANPWDTLPTYWSNEVSAVSSVPEPEVWTGLLAGLAVLGWRKRKRAA